MGADIPRQPRTREEERAIRNRMRAAARTKQRNEYTPTSYEEYSEPQRRPLDVNRPLGATS